MSIARTLALILCSIPLFMASLVKADVVTDWNQTAVRATEVAALPPPPQTRVLAMVHAAIYDAVNAIDRRHAAYAVERQSAAGASLEAAAAAAGHRMLSLLFPAQQGSFDSALNGSLAKVAEGNGKNMGIELGREVAEKLFAMRQSDGASVKTSYTFGTGPGVYQKTPPMNLSPVLPHWRQVKPFVLKNATQLTPPGPPAYSNAGFVKDFNEVKELGALNSKTRTSEQTAIALYWAGSEIPPMNAIGRAMATAKGLGVADNARLFAYLNMAMADSMIAGFEAKYRFNAWRPVTAIRNAATTGNIALKGDPTWNPLMVTPPHPEYPSAHCLATGAAAAVLTGLLGTDKVEVSLIQPPLGFHRSYTNIPEIVKEMENARVWGGIHFRSADEHGTQLGRQIGDYALRNLMQPVGNKAAAL